MPRSSRVSSTLSRSRAGSRLARVCFGGHFGSTDWLIAQQLVNQEWHDLMPLSPLPRPTVSRKLWQCAGASVALPFGCFGFVFPALQDFVSLVEMKWSSVRENREGSAGWNAGGSGCEWSGSGGECSEEEQGDDRGGGGFIGGVARCQQWLQSVDVVRAMWNVEIVPVVMWMRGQEEADRWCPFVMDLIENCPSRAVCSLVRTGISCGGDMKMLSNEQYQNTADLIMERSVTDLYYPGNDVTMLCSSAIFKFTNAGSEWQRKAMQREALVDATNLQQNIRRRFILIDKSRVDQDRKVPLYDSKIYSATFKEQVKEACAHNPWTS